MMRARAALFRHIQIFFETHLRSRYVMSDLIPYEPPPAERHERGKRRYEYGKLKEIVEGRFGEWEILLASPLEVPPLGRVTLRHLHTKVQITGPIDPATFERMGEAVRQHTMEKV